MTAPSIDSWWKRFRPSGSLGAPSILYSPDPNWDTTLMWKVRLETTNTVGMCELIEFTNTAGDDSDLEAPVLASSDTLVWAMYIPDTEWNRRMMAKGNSVDYCTDALKATGKFQFSDDSPDGGAWVEAVLVIPGMVIVLKAANSITVKPMVLAYGAGSNKVDVTATGRPIGAVLGQIVSEAALHWIAVMAGWALT